MDAEAAKVCKLLQPRSILNGSIVGCVEGFFWITSAVATAPHRFTEIGHMADDTGRTIELRRQFSLIIFLVLMSGRLANGTDFLDNYRYLCLDSIICVARAGA